MGGSSGFELPLFVHSPFLFLTLLMNLGVPALFRGQSLDPLAHFAEFYLTQLFPLFSGDSLRIAGRNKIHVKKS